MKLSQTNTVLTGQPQARTLVRPPEFMSLPHPICVTSSCRIRALFGDTLPPPTLWGLNPHHSVARVLFSAERCRAGMLPYVDDLRADLGHLRILISVIAGIHQPYFSPQYYGSPGTKVCGSSCAVKKSLAAQWSALDRHFRQHARIIDRFRYADPDAVLCMWNTQRNEDGIPLSQFERYALIERHCELIGTWPK